MNTVRDFKFPFDITSLALFVNKETDDCAAVFASEAENAVHTASDFFAVFKVCRVQNGATTNMHEASLKHLWFGRVKHKRNTCLSSEATRNFIHVDRAVTSDVVNTHVEYVSTFTNLLGGNL